MKSSGRVAMIAVVVFAGCAAEDPTDEAQEVGARSDAVCTPVWNPTWAQGSGANNWWVEYAITGGTVVSASLELPGGSRVTLSNMYGKWVGPSSAAIATGTQVIVHARNSLGQDAQTLPFAYLTNRAPVTDPCAGTGADGGTDAGVDAGTDAGVDAGVRDAGVDAGVDAGTDAGCAPPPWNATWTQGSGANTWWVEYTITGSTIASAFLELSGGSRVTLTSQFGKWAGSPSSAIVNGTQVTLSATNTLGQTVRTVPFGYLQVTSPQTAGCTGPPPPPPTVFNVPLTSPSVNGYTLTNAFPGVTFSLPQAIVWPVNSSTPFVLERVGRISQITGTTKREVLNFTSRVRQVSEAGALGMALHPAFGDGTGANAYVYVWYNGSNSTQRLSRFTWNPTTRVFGSEFVLIEEPETTTYHNAGHLQFGPDGFLYFGNGDDLNSANHQTLTRALFAGIFRIDVDMRGGAVSHLPPRKPTGATTQGYFIPNDNPFVGVTNANEEFWALGLRNPFGWSFDQQTGALWVGDVGETAREEVNRIVKGGNYQWPWREGELVLSSNAITIGTSTPPVFAYPHWEMADLSAILGGAIYRGATLPELNGKYVYSDWPSGRIWALDVNASPVVRTTLVDNKWNAQPMAMGQDNGGEIYLLQVDTISRLVRDSTHPMPALLSQTGVFTDLSTLTPDSSFVPYDVNSPLWSDGAAKTRWIRVPPGQRVTVNSNGSFSVPAGTIFIKHFDLPASFTPVGRTRRLETRLLVVGSDTVYGVTYRWNTQGTDAQLITEPTFETLVDGATNQSRTRHFPSLSQCWECHRPENRVLGFNGPQLAMTETGGGSQLNRLISRGVFASGAFSTQPTPLTRPTDTSATIENRSLSYLAGNCAPCHHAGASYLGGGETWNASPGVALSSRGLLNAPNHNFYVANQLGIPNAPLISPGNPANSLLWARMNTAVPDLGMPPLTHNVVDSELVSVIEAWIRSL